MWGKMIVVVWVYVVSATIKPMYSIVTNKTLQIAFAVNLGIRERRGRDRGNYRLLCFANLNISVSLYMIFCTSRNKGSEVHPAFLPSSSISRNISR